MQDYTSPICPIPCVGYCTRERCNFWDEEKEEYTGVCFDTYDPIDANDAPDPDALCVIPFYEDYD